MKRLGWAPRLPAGHASAFPEKTRFRLQIEVVDCKREDGGNVPNVEAILPPGFRLERRRQLVRPVV